jgi:hypothetical protein
MPTRPLLEKLCQYLRICTSGMTHSCDVELSDAVAQLLPAAALVCATIELAECAAHGQTSRPAHHPAKQNDESIA